MDANRLLRTAIIPAFDELAALGIPDSPQARRFVLAISMQESGLRHRRQVVNGTESGPASSFWQFEQGGGCKGVLNHKLTAQRMNLLCQSYNVEPSTSALWEAIRYNDILGAACARLLIYTLPHKLPETAVEGWEQYIEVWRPGKPREETWEDCWTKADKAVNGD